MTEFNAAELKELCKFGRKDLTPKQISGMESINKACQAFMETIYLSSPRSADQSAAIRSARLAAMQANAAIVWDSE